MRNYLSFKLISVSVPFSVLHEQVSRNNQESDDILESEQCFKLQGEMFEIAGTSAYLFYCSLKERIWMCIWIWISDSEYQYAL